MSQPAEDLLELNRLAAADDGKAGSLIDLMRREYAIRIISPGVADERIGG
ncbi:hypothetical protein [Caballeronia zhejiangensis]|nr:hypothetical protein [Caballeronia zhejiangensis]